MSVSKAEKTFNPKKLAIIATLGLGAAGLVFWVLNKTRNKKPRLSDEILLKILKERVKGSFIIYCQMSDYASELIHRLRQEGLIKNPEMSPEEIGSTAKIIHSPEFPFNLKLQAISINVAAKYGFSIEDVNDYITALQKRSNVMKELIDFQEDMGLLMTSVYKGQKPFIPAKIPSILTKEVVLKVIKESTIVYIRKVGAIFMGYVARNEPIDANIKLFNELKNVRNRDDVLEVLGKYSELFELEYHALNYFYCAVSRYSEQDEEFGRMADSYGKMAKEMVFKLLSFRNRVSIGKIESLVSELQEYDPQSALKKGITLEV